MSAFLIEFLIGTGILAIGVVVLVLKHENEMTWPQGIGLVSCFIGAIMILSSIFSDDRYRYISNMEVDPKLENFRGLNYYAITVGSSLLVFSDEGNIIFNNEEYDWNIEVHKFYSPKAKTHVYFLEDQTTWFRINSGQHTLMITNEEVPEWEAIEFGRFLEENMNKTTIEERTMDQDTLTIKTDTTCYTH